MKQSKGINWNRIRHSCGVMSLTRHPFRVCVITMNMWHSGMLPLIKKNLVLHRTKYQICFYRWSPSRPLLLSESPQDRSWNRRQWSGSFQLPVGILRMEGRWHLGENRVEGWVWGDGSRMREVGMQPTQQTQRETGLKWTKMKPKKSAAERGSVV